MPTCNVKSTHMTLVFTPKDDAAVNYFDTYPQETINLDDLYMSHALLASEMPETVDNTMVGDSLGRAQIVLDPALL